jgi:hypothetical protein
MFLLKEERAVGNDWRTGPGAPSDASQGEPATMLSVAAHEELEAVRKINDLLSMILDHDARGLPTEELYRELHEILDRPSYRLTDRELAHVLNIAVEDIPDWRRERRAKDVEHLNQWARACSAQTGNPVAADALQMINKQKRNLLGNLN